jgi:hypothetical protein
MASGIAHKMLDAVDVEPLHSLDRCVPFADLDFA